MSSKNFEKQEHNMLVFCYANTAYNKLSIKNQLNFCGITISSINNMFLIMKHLKEFFLNFRAYTGYCRVSKQKTMYHGTIDFEFSLKYS